MPPSRLLCVLLGATLATAGARAAPFVDAPEDTTLRLDSAVAPDGQPVPVGASAIHRIDLGPVDRLGSSKDPGVVRTKHGTYVVTRLVLEVVSGDRGSVAVAPMPDRRLLDRRPFAVDSRPEPIVSTWAFARPHTLFARLTDAPKGLQVWLAMGTAWDASQAVRLSDVPQPVATGLLPGDKVPCAVSFFARDDQTGRQRAGVSFTLR